MLENRITLKRWAAAVTLALAGAIWFYLLVLPWPLLVRWRNPGKTALMELRLDQARDAGEELELSREWVPLDDISPNLRRAVILSEDNRFYEHAGIDWSALREELHYKGDDDFSFLDPSDLLALAGAVNYYRSNREKIRGRSTITQQLAKNLYFGPERSLLRKFDEFVVAKRLEWFLPKDRILEIYLNIAEWGPGIFGAEAAAQHYYHRSAADLTRAQAAALASTLPHPLTSNPLHHPTEMRWRQQRLMGRM